MRLPMSLALALLLASSSGRVLGNGAGPYLEAFVPDRLMHELSDVQWHATEAEDGKENTRLVSSLLAVTLGPFGAHRLYLGTRPRVAVLYGLTFGGFGVLVLMDLGHLLFSKDLKPYRDNGRVFMWNAQHEDTTPP